MNPAQLKSVIEGLIFTHHEPMSVETLAAVLKGIPGEMILSAVTELQTEYRERARGFVLVRVAGGYQFRTLPEVAPWIIEMKRIKPTRLSRAGLEILSIVAYNQPITKSRIEQIRGVESSASIRSLLERELIVVLGRKEIPGRPLLYGTSKRFLEIFGLSDLAALPPLPDAEQIRDVPGGESTP